jgi:hypothetical protein
MHELQRRYIKQLRRKMRRDIDPNLLMGFHHRMKQKIRTQKYEILRTDKANRREQQRQKQEQKHLCLGGGENPWCGWCNTIPSHMD